MLLVALAIVSPMISGGEGKDDKDDTNSYASKGYAIGEVVIG